MQFAPANAGPKLQKSMPLPSPGFGQIEVK